MEIKFNYYFSFLKAFAKYFRDNNISKDTVIVFDMSLFDKFFNFAVSNKIIQFCGSNLEDMDITYSLEYDNLGNLCLIAWTNYTSPLIIMDSSLDYYDAPIIPSISLYGSAFKVAEKLLIEDAAVLKLCDDIFTSLCRELDESDLDDISKNRKKREYFDQFCDTYFEVNKRNKREMVTFSEYEEDYRKSCTRVIQSMRFCSIRKNKIYTKERDEYNNRIALMEIKTK